MYLSKICSFVIYKRKKRLSLGLFNYKKYRGRNLFLKATNISIKYLMLILIKTSKNQNPKFSQNIENKLINNYTVEI